MLHFGKTEERKKEYPLIEKGDYEAIITLSYAKTNNEGVEYINCECVIRDDVPQNYAGRKVWRGIYKNKVTQQYPDTIFSIILDALPKLPRDYESYDDLMLAVNGKAICISVDIQKADPNYPGSKDKNVIKYFEETSYPLKEENEEKSFANLDSVNVEEEDLPF